jgi:toxin YoeB
MRIVFTESAWGDYQWFQDRDRRLVKRINALIKDILRSPFEGIGKPEALRPILLASGRDELIKNIASSTQSRRTT